MYISLQIEDVLTEINLFWLVENLEIDSDRRFYFRLVNKKQIN